MPLALWENIPYLFHPDDMKHMPKLERDLLFTAEHLHTKIRNPDVPTVPVQFQRNRLLHMIKENPDLSPDELVDKILKSHAHCKLMERFPEIKERQRQKWLNHIHSLVNQGLVHMTDGRLTLTEKGKTHYNKLMEMRKRIRSEIIG